MTEVTATKNQPFHVLSTVMRSASSVSCSTARSESTIHRAANTA